MSIKKTIKQQGQNYYLKQRQKLDTLREEVENWHGGMTKPMSYKETLKWLRSEQALWLGNRTCYKKLGGIYEWVHKTGLVAYVGESGQIYNRLGNHRQAFNGGEPYVSPSGKSGKSVPCQYKMKQLDDNADNWLVKIRLIKTDCVNFRRFIEKKYEDRDQPKFNDKKMNRKAA